MTSSEKHRVRVEVFSDYTCPWCYIGWARLERLREELDDAELDVAWLPFEIHPEVPDEGMPVEELPYSDEQWESMMEHLREQARDEGLEVGARPKVSNTHRALAAGAWAQSEHPESFPDFHEALFRAYFAEGRDLGDPQVLREVARESGLDPDEMDEALAGRRWEKPLDETTAEARRLGVTGTPTFVFDRTYAAVGAQPTELLRDVVEKVLEEAPAG